MTNYRPDSKCNYNRLTMETSFQVRMPPRESLEILQMNWRVLNLWYSKLHLASIKDYTAIFRLYAQVQKEFDHAKSLSQKTLFHIDANVTPLYLLPSTSASSCYRMESPTHGIARLKLAISHMRHFQYYSLTTRMFTIWDNLTSSTYR